MKSTMARLYSYIRVPKYRSSNVKNWVLQRPFSPLTVSVWGNGGLPVKGSLGPLQGGTMVADATRQIVSVTGNGTLEQSGAVGYFSPLIKQSDASM